MPTMSNVSNMSHIRGKIVLPHLPLDVTVDHLADVLDLDDLRRQWGRLEGVEDAKRRHPTGRPGGAA